MASGLVPNTRRIFFKMAVLVQKWSAKTPLLKLSSPPNFMAVGKDVRKVMIM